MSHNNLFTPTGYRGNCFLRNKCKDDMNILRCFDDDGNIVTPENKHVERNIALHERHYQLAMTRFISLENLTKENVDYLIDNGELTIQDIYDHYNAEGIDIPDGVKYYMVNGNYKYPKCTPKFQHTQETFEELKNKAPRIPEPTDNTPSVAAGAGDVAELTQEDIDRRRQEYRRVMETNGRSNPQTKSKPKKTRKVTFSKQSRRDHTIEYFKKNMEHKYDWINMISNNDIMRLHNLTEYIGIHFLNNDKSDIIDDKTSKLQNILDTYDIDIRPNTPYEFSLDFNKKWKEATTLNRFYGGKRKGILRKK
jgi:hypothetical protein